MPTSSHPLSNLGVESGAVFWIQPDIFLTPAESHTVTVALSQLQPLQIAAVPDPTVRSASVVDVDLLGSYPVSEAAAPGGMRLPCSTRDVAACSLLRNTR